MAPHKPSQANSSTFESSSPTMLRLPDDEFPPFPHNDLLEEFDFDACCALDGERWMELDNNDSQSGDFGTGLHNSDLYTDRLRIDLQYASHGSERASPRTEVSNVANIFGSCEMEVDPHVNDLYESKHSFHSAFPDEPTRPHIPNDGCTVPIASSSITPRDGATNTDTAQHDQFTAAANLLELGGTTRSTSSSAIFQHWQENPHGARSNQNHDQFVATSCVTARGHQNSRHFQPPGAAWTQKCQVSAVQDPKFGLPWVSASPHPNQYTTTTTIDPVRIPEPQYSHDSSHWPPSSGAYPGQHWRMESSHTQQYMSQLPFTSAQISDMNVSMYEDFPLSRRSALGLTRTHSPDSFRYRESFSSTEGNVLPVNSYVPTHDSSQHNRHRSDVDMRSIEPETSAAHLRSAQQSNRRPKGSKSRPQKRNPIRALTKIGLENYRKVRQSHRGACKHCQHQKKQCYLLISVPCHDCQKIVGALTYLAPAICFGKNFEQVFMVYDDLFGIGQRDKSIKIEIESMYGDEDYLFLGQGLREHGNLISIDVDPSNVRLVRIQQTNSHLRQPWISTQDSALAAGMADLRGNSKEKSYAIVPDSMPDLSDLDKWGRQDIRPLAQKWPSYLEAAYDLAFLKYSEVTPPLPCYKIVQATMRIVSLGKNLDSRRPIDHNKSVEMITNLPPSQFGIEEFNECKADFQLSMLAKTQLYTHAARGIEETQQILGKELDFMFQKDENGRTMDNFLLVGACLRRLGLEYRQRLERYREFASGQVDDRIERCFFMYTFFTRLYDLWYRDRTLPISPGWTATDFRNGLGNDQDLVNAFQKLGFLEQEFCATRLKESNDSIDDSIYRKLIVERAVGKSGKVPKVKKARTMPHNLGRSMVSASSCPRSLTMA